MSFAGWCAWRLAVVRAYLFHLEWDVAPRRRIVRERPIVRTQSWRALLREDS